MKRPKITIVTVVKNDAEGIRKTIDSVIAQDYDIIEYVIKDGISTDGTVEIIKDAASAYPFIRFVSSKDAGIYDAMNQAMRLVSGDYTQFLNAGDVLASSFVISRVALAAADSRAAALYGDIIYINEDGSEELRKYGKLCANRLYYLTGDCINHQALFTATKLLRREHFDTSYAICADREWMLRIGMHDRKMKMRCLDFPIAYYPLDGASVINKAQYRAEADRCIKKHMPAGYPVFAFFEFLRDNKKLAEILHRLYRTVFIDRDFKRM